MNSVHSRQIQAAHVLLDHFNETPQSLSQKKGHDLQVWAISSAVDSSP